MLLLTRQSAALALGYLFAGALHAATCVAYPAGQTVLDMAAGRALELSAAKELEPCVGRVAKGRLVVVVRGADGLTQTREFREGDVFDAAAVGVARPGKLLAAVLLGNFVSRPGYSRGPLEHPEALGLPVGDILLPPPEGLAIGPAKDVLAAGYDQLKVFRAGESTPLWTLRLGGADSMAQLPSSALQADGRYAWALSGTAGVQEGLFHVLDARRQAEVWAQLPAAKAAALGEQVQAIGQLMDAELTFDAVQRQRALARLR